MHEASPGAEPEVSSVIFANGSDGIIYEKLDPVFGKSRLVPVVTFPVPTVEPSSSCSDPDNAISILV